MLNKNIKIGGKMVPLRASATVPRLYRAKFGRDIFKDMESLTASFSGKIEEGTEIPINDLELFENLSYIMAYHADHTIPDNVNDWLDQFDMFSIYKIMPQLLELWNANSETEIESKKNLEKVSGS